jgi:hypothetical protein
MRHMQDERKKHIRQRKADHQKSNAKMELHVMHSLTPYLIFLSTFGKAAWTT